jgi:AcrR family transcriptional regulator
MPRVIEKERVSQLAEVAARIFIERGYRRTQVADVAEALGVAKGTLYGYVTSKEALFDLAVRHADRPEGAPEVSELPLQTPQAGATVAYVRERLVRETADMTLVRVARGELQFDEPKEELRAIVSDLYRRLARNRQVVKLIDRCAHDYPELARAWLGDGRSVQVELLAAVLTRGMEVGRYQRQERPDLVARTVIEMVAFWALHRHFDVAPPVTDDETAERALIALLAGGLVAEDS